MKKLMIVCIVLNLFIVAGFAIFLFSTGDKEIAYMHDVVNYSLNEAKNELDDYKLEINYIESELDYNSVVYTIPSKNELTQKGQTIKIFVSLGYVTKSY